MYVVCRICTSTRSGILALDLPLNVTFYNQTSHIGEPLKSLTDRKLAIFFLAFSLMEFIFTRTSLNEADGRFLSITGSSGRELLRVCRN